MNNNMISRQQACYYLGVKEDAGPDEIKKAYHTLVKRYHPDANPNVDTREYYITIQKAYEFLLHNPYKVPVYGEMSKQHFAANSVQKRPTRIFQTDAQVREQYRKQKILEAERQKARKRQEAARQQQKKQSQSVTPSPAQGSEEEILNKIRAIWLAETIKRQIALDKEKKDAENKRKLYQAFMQQKLHEDEAKKYP